MAVTFQQRGGAGVGGGACGEAVINTRRHQRCDATTMGAGVGGNPAERPNPVFLEEGMDPSKRSNTLPDDSRDKGSGRRNIVCKGHR